MKTVIVVSPQTISRAQSQICGCERCSCDAGLIFDFILDEVTGMNPEATYYLLSEPAICPICGTDVFEDTLVEPAGMETARRIYPYFLN